MGEDDPVYTENPYYDPLYDQRRLQRVPTWRKSLPSEFRNLVLDMSRGRARRGTHTGWFLLADLLILTICILTIYLLLKLITLGMV